MATVLEASFTDSDKWRQLIAALVSAKRFLE